MTSDNSASARKLERLRSDLADTKNPKIIEKYPHLGDAAIALGLEKQIEALERGETPPAVETTLVGMDMPEALSGGLSAAVGEVLKQFDLADKGVPFKGRMGLDVQFITDDEGAVTILGFVVGGFKLEEL